MSFEKVINAWREAEKDLKIKIQSPFILITSGGEEIKFELLIEHFGRTTGTIITSMENTYDSRPGENGYFYSALNPDRYSVYERKHFIDTLNDWGYFGEESAKPDWYTGQPWT